MYDILVSEVMSNPLDEDTGEFVEIYNAGSDTVDLAGLALCDGDSTDTLTALTGTTLLGPGGYAVVLDAEYAGEYGFDASAVLVTTDDNTLGNTLSVSDQIYLLETDGLHRIDAFLHPSNPGNGLSVERTSFTGPVTADDWAASTCPSGASPSVSNCAGDTTDPTSTLKGILIMTEVMANAASESTGEFVELYNDGTADIDLAGFILYDGDASDPLQGFTDPVDTILTPMHFAVILDADYAGEYDIPEGTLLLTTDDSALASGLAVDDPVYLYEANGVSYIDSCTWATDPGDGVSLEKVDLTPGDRETNWKVSACAEGSSPGDGPCFP